MAREKRAFLIPSIKHASAAFVCLGVLLCGSAVWAWSNTLFLEGGGSPDASAGFKVTYSRDLGWRWLESGIGLVSPTLEAGVGFFLEDGSSDVFAFEALPLFKYIFKTDSSVQVYLEGGAGGAYLTEEHIEGNDLGGHVQFVDIFGLGCRLGRERQHSLGLRFVHYSNAGLHEKNEGINYLHLCYGFAF